MRSIFSVAFYLFHPLWIPSVASLFYFLYNPHPFPHPIIEAKMLAIIILTIFIPLVILFLSKKTYLLTSNHIKSLTQYRFYLIFSAVAFLSINFLILNRLYQELSYFFTAALFSSGVLYFMSFLNHRISLHTTAMSALLGFILGMSLTYTINILGLISLFIFLLGWVGSSRLYFETNTQKEILWGTIVGLFPQILFFCLVNYYSNPIVYS